MRDNNCYSSLESHLLGAFQSRDPRRHAPEPSSSPECDADVNRTSAALTFLLGEAPEALISPKLHQRLYDAIKQLSGSSSTTSHDDAPFSSYPSPSGDQNETPILDDDYFDDNNNGDDDADDCNSKFKNTSPNDITRKIPKILFSSFQCADPKYFLNLFSKYFPSGNFDIPNTEKGLNTKKHIALFSLFSSFSSFSSSLFHTNDSQFIENRVNSSFANNNKPSSDNPNDSSKTWLLRHNDNAKPVDIVPLLGLIPASTWLSFLLEVDAANPDNTPRSDTDNTPSSDADNSPRPGAATSNSHDAKRLLTYILEMLLLNISGTQATSILQEVATRPPLRVREDNFSARPDADSDQTASPSTTKTPASEANASSLIPFSDGSLPQHRSSSTRDVVNARPSSEFDPHSRPVRPTYELASAPAQSSPATLQRPSDRHDTPCLTESTPPTSSQGAESTSHTQTNVLASSTSGNLQQPTTSSKIGSPTRGAAPLRRRVKKMPGRKINRRTLRSAKLSSNRSSYVDPPPGSSSSPPAPLRTRRRQTTSCSPTGGRRGGAPSGSICAFSTSTPSSITANLLSIFLNSTSPDHRRNTEQPRQARCLSRKNTLVLHQSKTHTEKSPTFTQKNPGSKNPVTPRTK